MLTEAGTMGVIRNTTHTDDSNIYMAYTKAEPDSSFNNNIHCHIFYEIEFIISGSGKYEINNVQYDIKPGALFMVTPADFHTYSLSPSDTPLVFYNIQFYPHIISDEISSSLYSQTTPIAVYLDGTNFNLTRERFDYMLTTFEEKGFMYEKILRNEIENLCINILRDVSKRHRDSAIDNPVIRNAIIFVKNNFRDEITLKKAADYVGLSEAYFSHVFSTIMKMGFASYVRQTRLIAAANLIKSTSLPIKEICFDTGFTNTNYFTNTFSSFFGLSPREYRAKYGKKHR
ncbi:MAG: AraC family transcriptional regulator [Clostridiales bacterium]|jgi:AraC-like DNA-binding protein/mannose-6-phosphate isomerase-like protein (cupin superfamily)|nr:AraC family transcriptional regulator [Clostridiales bacterium]